MSELTTPRVSAIADAGIFILIGSGALLAGPRCPIPNRNSVVVFFCFIKRKNHRRVRKFDCEYGSGFFWGRWGSLRLGFCHNGSICFCLGFIARHHYAQAGGVDVFAEGVVDLFYCQGADFVFDLFAPGESAVEIE